MNPGSVLNAWTLPSALHKYTAAVSLHSHTQYSKELLDFVPRYARRIPLVSYLVRRQEQRYKTLHGGRELNFSDGWWTPPLSAREAFDLERGQIEDQLGLRAMVSLSDHDTIEAPMALHVLPEMRDVPISLEWTVPFGPSFFHVGVHNLPLRWAHDVTDRLASYTAHPHEHRLPEMFSILHGLPSVLIVLNHPLWDEPGIGATQHRDLLLRFVANHREWLHAFEWNGLRPWSENRDVAQLASEFGVPVISGGDRHGCEPNSLLNLTRAESFSEFVAEVRDDRRSEMLLMPQSREALKMRLMQGVLDVLRDYDDKPQGRRRWTDRVFFRCADDIVRPLSALWQGDGPGLVKLFVASTRLVGSSPIRNALRAVLAERQEVSA